MSRYAHHSDPLIDDAIERAFATHPYYASAIQRLRIVADESVPTMATSASWVTHYNPTTLKSWTPEERAAVLVHELEHLLRDHNGRCGHRDPGQWNVAADAEINQRLANLPDGAVYPESLNMPRGQAAETYYGAAGGAKPQDPDGDGDGDASGDGGNTPGAGMPGAGQQGNCGSAAGGPTQAHEKGDAARPGSGASDPDAAKQDAAKHVLQSGAPGTEEGSELRAWAESTIGIDRAAWMTAIASVVGSVAAPHGAPTRWRWPGRRDPRDMGGAMVPRWVGERPSLAVLVDTSSSITPADLDMARAAGHFISRVADVRFYACDTHAYSLGRTMPDSLPGGGGTRLTNGIAMAIEEGAHAVIVITDCMTPWPDEPTPVPLIVAANLGAHEYVLGPDASMAGYTPPEWATVIPVVLSDYPD